MALEAERDRDRICGATVLTPATKPGLGPLGARADLADGGLGALAAALGVGLGWGVGVGAEVGNVAEAPKGDPLTFTTKR